MRLQAVVLDWAGTVVDFGCQAPPAALRSAFEACGVALEGDEPRHGMGLPKKDQVRGICALPRVRNEWAERHGGEPGEEDIERIYQVFLPAQAGVLRKHAELIPGVVETVARWRRRGLRIGSTTGYPRALLDVVREEAARQGFAPDVAVVPEEVGGGRPLPWMCYQAAILLRTAPLWAMVKIGDTPADVEEGLAAGMWTVGVTVTGNEVGLTRGEWEALAPGEREESRERAEARLLAAGAHAVVDAVAEADAVLEEFEVRLGAGERP